MVTPHTTFRGLPVLRETTADKVNLPDLLIKPDMAEYAGWDYAAHIRWVRDLTKLPVLLGMILATDESCSVVWLLARDDYKTKCRLIYLE